MATTDSAARFQVLSYPQVIRLDEVLKTPVYVHGRGNFPTLDVTLLDLVDHLREKLEANSIDVRCIRLNGGAASYVLCSDENQTYNDLDLIFGVDLSNAENTRIIKDAVFESLLNFLPEGVCKERMTPCTMQEAYTDKMVKIYNDNDRWSLISLLNITGKNVELKFVDRMRRQFEFSVDSFQIVLDSLLFFNKLSEVAMTRHFYPTVIGESVFGNFEEALYHLDNKLIATRNPEEIRGGGLLKYCNLLVRDYSPACQEEIKSMERYMCSRFFIDFSELPQQKQKLESYLNSHFAGDDVEKYEYLIILRRVVDSSTVCLMGHERRQTLKLITDLAQNVQWALAFKSQPKKPMRLYSQFSIGLTVPIPPHSQQNPHHMYNNNNNWNQQNHHHHRQLHHHNGRSGSHYHNIPYGSFGSRNNNVMFNSTGQMKTPFIPQRPPHHQTYRHNKFDRHNHFNWTPCF